MRRVCIAVVGAMVLVGVARAGMHCGGEDKQAQLVEAVNQADAARVAALLRDGADPLEVVGQRGMNAVGLALMFGDAPVIQTIIDSGVKLSEVEFGWNPLDLLMFREDASAKVVGLLLDAGLKMSPEMSGGRTLLMTRAATHNVEVARLLLDRGEKVDALDKSKTWTALSLAVWDGSADVVKLLLDEGANAKRRVQGSNMLHLTTRGSAPGRGDIAKLLVAAGLDVDEPDSSGWTPLMNAMFAQSEECVEALIEAGANVNRKGRSGTTPLMAAATHGNAAIVTQLIKAGAKVNATDNWGRSALRYTLASGDPAHSYRSPKEGRTDALDGEKDQDSSIGSLIARAERLDTKAKVRALIDAGSDVNATDTGGWTPLMLAAYMWDGTSLERKSKAEQFDRGAWERFERSHDPCEIAKMLIDAGAVRIVGGAGDYDCLQVAAQRGDSRRAEMIRLLRGAKVERRRGGE